MLNFHVQYATIQNSVIVRKGAGFVRSNMRRKWFRIFLRRRLFVALLLFLQVCFLIFLVSLGSKYYSIVTVLLTLICRGVASYPRAEHQRGYKLYGLPSSCSSRFSGTLPACKTQTSTRKYCAGSSASCASGASPARLRAVFSTERLPTTRLCQRDELP